MNREAVPLVIGIMLPIIFVAVIILYLSGLYDIMVYLRQINIIYYIVLIPFGLGFLGIILWFRKPRE